MSLLAAQLLLICLSGWFMALRLLPLSGPGRYALCLGLGGLFGLISTGALTWLTLAVSGVVLAWVPLAFLLVLALVTEALVRVGLFWSRPLVQWSSPLAERSLSRWELALGALFLALIVLRLLSLLPDVLMRPLFAWDAWTVWGYEARVWLETGRYVEFLPRSDWLDAPAEAFLREGLIAYPRLVPALILWASAGSETWTGVGPGLLWLLAAGLTALILYGALRQLDLPLPWALGAAYAWLSIPLLNAHIALYGYADIWVCALLGAFAALLMLGELKQQRLWFVLACLAVLPLPLIKEEGLYWLLCAAAALLAGWRRIGPRALLALSLAGLGGLMTAQMLGIDLVGMITRGRLSLTVDELPNALLGAARHAFFWFDWHLFVPIALVVMVMLLIKPRLAAGMLALSAFCLLGLLLLWVITPMTGASAFLAVGTLFSRLLLHLSAALLLLCALVLYRLLADQHGDWNIGSSALQPRLGMRV